MTVRKAARLTAPSLFILALVAAIGIAGGSSQHHGRPILRANPALNTQPEPGQVKTDPRAPARLLKRSYWGRARVFAGHRCVRGNPCVAVVVLGPSSSRTRTVTITSRQERFRNALAAVTVAGRELPGQPVARCGSHFEDRTYGVSVTATSCEQGVSFRVVLVNAAPVPRLVRVWVLEVERLADGLPKGKA